MIRWLIGVDEAGRGPLAGPVAVAAFAIPLISRSRTPGNKGFLENVRDSKKLSERQREAWYKRFCGLRREKIISFACSFVSASVIDKRGIAAAVRLGVARSLRKLNLSGPTQTDAVRGASEHATKLYGVYCAEAAERSNEEMRRLRRSYLNPTVCTVLLDGSLKAPPEYKNQKTIIHGDDIEPIISAASIVAKVRRDRLMRRLAKQYPDYGLEIHKGYGTKAHYAALARLGPSVIHRSSFLVL